MTDPDQQQGADGGERAAGVNPNQANEQTWGNAREVEEAAANDEPTGPTPGA